jgi:hypothetical protein
LYRYDEAPPPGFEGLGFFSGGGTGNWADDEDDAAKASREAAEKTEAKKKARAEQEALKAARVLAEKQVKDKVGGWNNLNPVAGSLKARLVFQPLNLLKPIK